MRRHLREAAGSGGRRSDRMCVVRDAEINRPLGPGDASRIGRRELRGDAAPSPGDDRETQHDCRAEKLERAMCFDPRGKDVPLDTRVVRQHDAPILLSDWEVAPPDQAMSRCDG
jgi:hypothetical protein